MHCLEKSKHILEEKKLRGLVPHFMYFWAIYTYIPTIGPQMQYNKIGGPIVGIYKSLTNIWM